MTKRVTDYEDHKDMAVAQVKMSLYLQKNITICLS